MKLVSQGSNSNELQLRCGMVLFSCETPVAISVDCQGIVDSQGFQYFGCYRTAAKFSVTTSKHINRWTETKRTIPHEVLVELVAAMMRHE